MDRFEKLIPRPVRIPLILTLAMNFLAYFGTRLLNTGWTHHCLAGTIDGRIPLIPWTVVIYVGCYIFWIVNYLIGARQKPETAFRFLGADLIARTVCLVCFLVFPTIKDRPAIEGISVWDTLLKLLYLLDAPDNLFPSIHCLTSWFCWIAVRRNPDIPAWYRFASLIIALAICVSTLTTKQHVLADVFAGVFLAEICYLFVWKSGLSGRYQNTMTRIAAKRKETLPECSKK